MRGIGVNGTGRRGTRRDSTAHCVAQDGTAQQKAGLRRRGRDVLLCVFWCGHVNRNVSWDDRCKHCRQNWIGAAVLPLLRVLRPGAAGRMTVSFLSECVRMEEETW